MCWFFYFRKKCCCFLQHYCDFSCKFHLFLWFVSLVVSPVVHVVCTDKKRHVIHDSFCSSKSKWKFMVKLSFFPKRRTKLFVFPRSSIKLFPELQFHWKLCSSLTDILFFLKCKFQRFPEELEAHFWFGMKQKMHFSPWGTNVKILTQLLWTRSDRKQLIWMILSTKTDGFFCHGVIQLPFKIGSNANNRQLSCQLEGRPF